MEKVGTIKVNGVEHDLFDLQAENSQSEQFLKKVHQLIGVGCTVKSVYRRKGIPRDYDYDFDEIPEKWGLALICPQPSRIQEVKV